MLENTEIIIKPVTFYLWFISRNLIKPISLGITKSKHGRYQHASLLIHNATLL